MLLKAIIASLASGVIAAEGITSPNPPHHVVIPPGPVPLKASDPAYNKTIKHFECGTTGADASPHFLATVGKLHKQQLAAASASSSSGSNAARARFARRAAAAAASSQTITVPLYIHVVTSQSSAGSITSKMVNAQFNVLNKVYNQQGVNFVLQGTDYTVNDDWATDATSTSDTAMKTALRKGSYNTLNLYFQTDLYGGILGMCSLPTTVTSDPSSYVTDGCNISAESMPGGSTLGYNLGMTAVHETGHWLGLLHTFEGYSCAGPGDYIADTPPESQSTSGCPINPMKNSCPRTNPNVFDPLHNYMDYSIDSCYTRFTPDQKQRIFSLWTEYRQAFGGGLSGEASPSNSSTNNTTEAASAYDSNSTNSTGYGYGSDYGSYGNRKKKKKNGKKQGSSVKIKRDDDRDGNGWRTEGKKNRKVHFHDGDNGFYKGPALLPHKQKHGAHKSKAKKAHKQQHVHDRHRQHGHDHDKHREHHYTITWTPPALRTPKVPDDAAEGRAMENEKMARSMPTTSDEHAHTNLKRFPKHKAKNANKAPGNQGTGKGAGKGNHHHHNHNKGGADDSGFVGESNPFAVGVVGVE